jgi:hypothetical protein
MRNTSTVCACIEVTGIVGCGGTPGTDAGADAAVARDATIITDTGVRDAPSMPPARTNSESIQSPTSGRLERAARSVMTPTFVLANTGRNAYYGTEETVFWLTTGFNQVRARHPSAQLSQLRDVSVQNGGVPSGDWPHSSHQSGRDADGTYYLRVCSATSGCPLADAPLDQFDAVATWTLFETWLRAGVTMYIFVDYTLQRPLYEEARRRGATPTELSRWIQYPRASTVREGVIRHVSNHRNHYHVRFVCPADDARCVQ